MLNHVERLVKNGFAVHRLKPKSKAPIGDDWSTVPVLTFEQLTKKYRPGENLGVRLGKWSKVHGYYLHVIDADIRDHDKTVEAFDALGDAFPDYMDYPEVQSGSGGASRHFYILCDKPFSSKKIAHSEEFDMVFDKKLGRKVKKWKWEIELFGTGKQVVIPPSIHPDTGKPYRWITEFDFTDVIVSDGPVIDSELLYALVGDDSNFTYDPEDERYQPIGVDMEEAERIISKLPVDEWIEDRDGWYRVGMALHHEFRGSSEAFDLWCSISKLSKKFDKKDTKRVWKSFKNRHRPFRMASLRSVARDVELEEEFLNLEDDIDDMDAPKKKRTKADDLLGDVEPESEYLDLGEDGDGEIENTPRARKLRKSNVEAELGNVPPKVARLNKRHALAFVKGKTIVITEQKNGEISYGSLNDLHSWYENDRVATEKSTEPVTKAWVRHKKRRQYPEGIEFAPNQETPGAYNLWRGWSVEPDPLKSCRRFLKHLKSIICRGDETVYRYILGWLAHMVQAPEDKPGVAIVVRGRKGAGKDTIAEYFSGILKHHYMMINQREHLVGKFNAHQEKLMFLHVEEGYWAGSKQDEGPLKSIITSPTVTIERKNVDAFKVNSVLRIFMTSNEDWVVPASGQDERRYCVVDVDDAWARSGRFGKIAKDRKAYFDGLHHEMKHGGREALLAYLMEYDLTDFDVRDPPHTAALDEQKLAGLHGVDRWWADQLMSGEIEFDVLDLSRHHPADWTKGDISAISDLIFESYTDWNRKQRFGVPYMSKTSFFLSLRKLAPIAKKRRRVDDERLYVVDILSLKECRKLFDKYLGSEINWQKYNIIDDDDPETDDDMD